MTTPRVPWTFKQYEPVHVHKEYKVLTWLPQMLTSSPESLCNVLGHIFQ